MESLLDKIVNLIDKKRYCCDVVEGEPRAVLMILRSTQLEFLVPLVRRVVFFFLNLGSREIWRSVESDAKLEFTIRIPAFEFISRKR